MAKHDFPHSDSDHSNQNRQLQRIQEWRSWLSILVGGGLAFLSLSGLCILLAPFNVANQVNVLVHTVLGCVFLIPCTWYLARHFLRYWRSPVSHILILGYIGLAALLACAVSGIVLTIQAAFGTRISYVWDTVHIVTTFAILTFVLIHILPIAFRDRKAREAGDTSLIPEAAGHFGRGVLVVTLGGVVLVTLLAYAYRAPQLRNEFPDDYSYKYGEDRPFEPSLAKTASGQAMDARLLSGSLSCGTAGCHEQIVQEWESSAHRYSAMDVGFQKVQMTMAQENGPESTRYCGGCHDPISLFSGTKNLFTAVEELTSLRGYQEGVSCLVCHSVREVDVEGNANYLVAQPPRYMFELEYDEKQSETKGFLRDFLIRSYPREHVNGLSKTLFKTPDYCASCHKQFIDEQVNNVGWVQLQNQYDNWKESRWNHPNEPQKTIECRECHMRLVDSEDPARGDEQDYNRSPDDGKHRSHRFVAANQFMPAVLKLPGWEEQVELTEKWLQGKLEVPEIAHKWQPGPVVGLEIMAPQQVEPSQKVALKVVITSNKVGHDFPTGPLDIIQAWVELIVTDDQNLVVYSTGTVDSRGFIQPGTFMFKAEPVDQYGNLIDRHNLWEMVGVRHRRALFPGFSDTAEFSFLSPDLAPVARKALPEQVSNLIGAQATGTRSLRVSARLLYRKIDQYLLNFLFGEEASLTSPVTEMTSDTHIIEVSKATEPAGSTHAGID
ncbi:MAG: hypothetical protein HYX73_00215 [Acidobacteria bacterium]|nr:hypothetical protein [Acidobacteriota bacterium]